MRAPSASLTTHVIDDREFARMNHRSLIIGLVLAIFFATFARPASADWYFANANPAVIFCYEKVDAYGGLYMIRTGVLNGTGTTQTGVADFYRRNADGSFSPQFSTTISSPPGVWKLGEPGYLSLYFNDRFKFRLNGTQIFQIDASAVPYYQYHCKVKYTGIAAVDSALAYGLAQLDAPYVGANNPFRFMSITRLVAHPKADETGDAMHRKTAGEGARHDRAGRPLDGALPHCGSHGTRPTTRHQGKS
jgi:hypothetical protein